MKLLFLARDRSAVALDSVVKFPDAADREAEPPTWRQDQHLALARVAIRGLGGRVSGHEVSEGETVELELAIARPQSRKLA